MNRRATALGLMVILLITSFSSGCWSRKEIEDLAVITLIGFDKINVNGKDKWELSHRVFQTGQIGAGGGDKSGLGAVDQLFTGTGESMVGADEEITRRLPKISFYGFTSAIVIGEKAAAENMTEILDLLLRFREFRANTFVLICKGEASKIIAAAPEITDSLAEEIENLVRLRTERVALSNRVDINEFVQTLLSPDRDPVAPRIETVVPEKDIAQKRPEKSVMLKGMAVFRDGKLVGWLDADESKGCVLISQSINRAQAGIEIVDGDKTLIFLLGQSKGEIKPVVVGDKISFMVNIKAAGLLTELHGLELNAKEVSNLEILASQRIQELAEKAISKSRELDSDFLGFGQALHIKNLSAWQRVVLGDRRKLLQSDIVVSVKAKVVVGGGLKRTLTVNNK